MSAPESWLARHAQQRAKHPALISTHGTLSYAALEADARSLAARLRGIGIEAGDRIPVLLENDPLYVVLIHALIMLGAVLVPLNIRLTSRELQGLLAELEPKLLLHGHELEERARESTRELASIQVLAAHTLHTLPEKPARASRAPTLGCDQAILFTSGTTGRPKGVRLSLLNQLASAMSSVQHLGAETHARWLACLPLYHVGGLAIVMRSAFYGRTVVLHERFDPQAVLQSIERDRVSALSLVPTMLLRLLEASGTARFPDSLRGVLLGGGPIAPELVARAQTAGLPVAPTYGLTEATSQVATLTPQEALERAQPSAGRVLPGLELRIVDEQGQNVPPEVPGEIWLHGAQVSAGYLKTSLETKYAGGTRWLRTGDIGQLSRDGYLTLLDRRSDLIVSGGENVYPAEVEAVLLSHPDVAAAAVVGAPDEVWGQGVHAFVVPRGERRPRAQELVAHCRAELAGFKLPRRVHIVASLPYTASGKLRRAELRKRLPGCPG